MKPTIAVVVSGGVDSMMAACLLKEQGHHVIGIHFVTGYESDTVFAPTRALVEGHPIVEIRFKSPIESITPGQGAVFYRDDEVLGGGFINPEG